ncbi:MAG TPA: hypothetical protein VNM69_22485 [Bacillus sp. (in: firmicutes)]|uniref:hypothetical protein n=1 Tax=Bacillus litorisediminis TaxID=2922713 RepID=UPI001FAECA05|nr:hypothetical protein [Bacillus litorisediminis]HWO78639.1 hypothetical protein [Bacillus sp. (in: firmicutes)]
MYVKRNLKDLTEFTSLKTIETFNYKESRLDEFREHFEFLKRSGFIIANSFKDNIWLFPCDDKDRDIIFRFDVEIYKEINTALKGYILLKRMSGKAISSCHTMLNHLKKSIMASSGFESMNQLEDFLLRQTQVVAYETAITIKQFLLFYEHYKKDHIIELCNSIPSPIRNNRSLPKFLDVLTFDEYLINYFKKSTQAQKIKYYPIYIWWRLTNVVPMRVIEFVKLRKNCIERREDNSYWLTISRAKKKADSPFKIDIEDTIQVNQEMYELIKEYNGIIDSIGIDTPYLFPYDLYVNFLERPYQSRRQRKGNQNRLIDKYLQRLIDDFYNEVIHDNDLEKISCGDTRHFAIMNMFLQGFNMLSIARMAGHDNLQTQMNYYSHIDHYVQSQVYNLSQKRFEESIGKSFSGGILGERRKAYDRGRIHSFQELSEYRRVDYGLCRDDQSSFPMNCVEDCRLCPHYIFKPPVNEVNEGIKWLEDYAFTLEQNIKETVEYILCVSKSMYYDLPNLVQQKTGQSKLDSASSRLQNLMDKMATVQARGLEFEYEK